ncbi:MAG: hypothetical protein JW839_08125, partial [Candidatus Lokiarchaeota archaeon]|nr:hypothetical protein [Candidatus Lokiarchaeota archaeon]
NTALSDENATSVNAGGSGTSRVAKIRFGSGTTLGGRVFESDLSSIPYTIGATPHSATGQVIPVLMGGIALGKSNQVGNYTQQSGVAVFGMVYLYSVNFPTWSGQALVHDPVFSTFISVGSGPGIWLYVGIALGGVAALVVILLVVRVRAKKRASSYPGMPRAAPGGAKAGPGAQRVDLLHSLFFHGKDPGDGADAPLEPYDEAAFAFFTSLVSARVDKAEPGTGSWTRVSARVFDSDPGIPDGAIDQLLGSRPVLSEDKHALQSDTGRAFSYKVRIGSGLALHLLDVFARPAVDDVVIRLTLCSRAALETKAYPAIESALCRLLAALARGAAGVLNEDRCETILDAYLPVQLAHPRRFATGDVVVFFGEVRQDDQLTPADLAEIEADLREMDDATAKRVSGSYKAAAARNGMDDGDLGGTGR